MQVEPMIAVKDVEASSAWYQRLLGCKNDHGGPYFDRLVDGQELLLMLHRLDGDEHAWLREDAKGPVGRGVILHFRIADLDAAHARAREMGAEILEPPHENELAGQRELELRDPDGYFVTLCQ